MQWQGPALGLMHSLDWLSIVLKTFLKPSTGGTGGGCIYGTYRYIECGEHQSEARSSSSLGSSSSLSLKLTFRVLEDWKQKLIPVLEADTSKL